MKPGAKKMFLNALIFPASVLSAFLARILCFHILGALFEAWNLTDLTISYAPLWAQRLASLSGDIADLSFLIFLALSSLLISKNMRVRFSIAHLIYPAIGIALSALTVGALLLIGSARMPKIRVFPFFGAFVVYVLTDFFAIAALACLARKLPGRIFSKTPIARACLSVLIQAAFWAFSKNSLSAVLIANACLLGLLLSFLHEKTKSVLPEILIVCSFRFFTRFVFGFPDLGGAYPVSEPLLTGAAEGASNSLLLSAYLIAILVFIFCRFLLSRRGRKGESYVST
ncbi:MAG: hypothetical protein IKJ65_02770 [Clostridia bacterium]|nr:hypothetical protein [Clostridia bacterium]